MFRCRKTFDYPLATFSSLKEIVGAMLRSGKRLGIVGRWDMPGPLYERVRGAVAGLEVVESDEILRRMR